MVTINPTVGRVLLFFPHQGEPLYVPDQPLAAIVARVHGPSCVNLMVIDAEGDTHGRTSVPLVQEGNPKPELGIGGPASYCAWMPYQTGQAAKTEQLERDIERHIAASRDAEARAAPIMEICPPRAAPRIG